MNAVSVSCANSYDMAGIKDNAGKVDISKLHFYQVIHVRQ